MTGGTITGQTYNLKQLFERAVYRIDYYQREYAWSADDVRTLIGDLFERFTQVWQQRLSRRRRSDVEPFFLGPFVYSEERGGLRFLVDGQQRFTTLHLIFIHLRRLANDFAKRDAVDKLGRVILDFDQSRRKFRIDIDERRPLLTALYEDRTYEVLIGASLSVRNLWERSQEIREQLDARLTADMCPHFVDWLLSQVLLVGIRAPNRDSGYQIFESMNDRGARLSPVDLVKSFLLSNVRTGEEDLNKQWRKMLAEVARIREDADAPKKFLKATLIGRYAEVGQPEDKDAGEIETALNIWVRRNKERRLGLGHPDDYFRFVEELLELSTHYVRFLSATRKPYHEDGLSALFYNETNGITGQLELVLAAIRPQDTPSEAKAKAALVANYLDRVFVIKVLNDESVDAREFGSEVRRLIPILRSCTTQNDVAKALAAEAPEEAFESIRTFGLRGNNRAQVRYLLARLTAYTEVGCGKKDLSEEYLASNRIWQIEHLWPRAHEPHRDEIPDAVTYRLLRSRIGALALLRQRDNATLGDLPFAAKVSIYARQENLLAILSAGHRTRNKYALEFASKNDVEGYFRNVGSKEGIEAIIGTRTELYRRLCLRIWDLHRLGFPAEAPAATAGDTGDFRPTIEAKPKRSSPARGRKLNTDVAKMVRAGIIAPQSSIVLPHNDTDYFATIDADGLIWLPTGDHFSKLDDAGRMITGRRCDGMKEWRVVTSDGNRVPVRELRDRATTKTS